MIGIASPLGKLVVKSYFTQIAFADHLSFLNCQVASLIKEVRLLRRAVFVVDKAGKIVYAAYMPTLGDEPDYNAVLQAAQSAL